FVAALAGAALAVGVAQPSAAPRVDSPGDGLADCYTTVAATRLVQALTSAFNAGDDRAVDRLFAPEPYFRWFAAWGRSRTSGRLGERADDRTTLRSYVRERHLHRERWTIVHSQGNGRGIAFSLIRRADDFPMAHVLGKGAALC